MSGEMIGHPVRRAWYERHHLQPGRPNAADPAVRQLVSRLAPDTDVVDLGGSDSLNLLLERPGFVMRVNKPFIGPRHILGEQDLRRQLATHGLTVASPIVRYGAVLHCGAFWAQLEEYVPHSGALNGAALFAAIGRLHRALATITRLPMRPMVSTCVSPGTLRRWLSLNRTARHPILSEPGRSDELEQLIRILGRQWVPSNSLPSQLIHNDAHPDNMQLSASGEPLYLDLGGVGRGPRIHDIAYALAYMLFWHEPGPAAFLWHDIPNLLAEYEHAADSPLTMRERQALVVYTAAVPIYYDVCDWGDRPVSHIARWLLKHPDAIPAT